MVLENERIRFTVEDTTGCITGFEDKKLNRAYVNSVHDIPPFRAVMDADAQAVTYRFSATSAHDSLQLVWGMEDATLEVHIQLLADGVSFRASLQNNDGSCIKAFEYPILSGLRDFGAQGYLAHSYATGVLLQNPLSYMPETGALRYTPYPESFSGASMQFFTYYEEDKGGLYFAALDGKGHQKWLNVYKEKDHLTASHMAGFENAVPGSRIDMTYDFTVRATHGNGWEEAAELYKAWAQDQPWCERGLAKDRTDKSDWLHEKVGYCTFGVNAGHDRTKWLRRYRQDIGTPGFHVLGPDWTNTPQTFGWGVPGDMCDWVPTKFNEENLQAIRENGDYFAPFEFDFMVAMNKSNPEKLRPHLQKFPSPTYSHDGYPFHMLCPCDPFTKEFHREKNLTMLREAHADAMYYDISANNLIKVCMDENHGHQRGGGKEITDGYCDVYADTHDALSKEAGKYIPLGTEMMNETFLSHLDFYQARAWAQPCSTLETYPFREQMRSGLAQMIPLFDYVYHEMGVVRMDGWGKLVDEIGSLFYYNVAKVYLWGGLYEINHEYSPMEELDGAENSGEDHYFHFDPQHCAYAPDRASYVKQFASLRTGAGLPYLAYGRMTKKPDMEIPEMDASWYHYNHGQTDTSYKARGVLKVKTVLTSAYEDLSGGYALFLANADEKPHELSFALSHHTLRLAKGSHTVRLLHGFGKDAELTTMDLGMLCEGETLAVSLTINPLTPYMLEIK